MKSRPVRWYHKLFYRWSSPYRHDVEQALKTMLHHGIGIGMRQQHRAHTAIYCDQCGTPAAYPDARFCALCGETLQHTGAVPPVRTRLPATDPITTVPPSPPKPGVQLPTKALLDTFNATPGGVHTKMQVAIGRAQMADLATRMTEKKARYT